MVPHAALILAPRAHGALAIIRGITLSTFVLLLARSYWISL